MPLVSTPTTGAQQVLFPPVQTQKLKTSFLPFDAQALTNISSFRLLEDHFNHYQDGSSKGYVV